MKLKAFPSFPFGKHALLASTFMHHSKNSSSIGFVFSNLAFFLFFAVRALYSLSLANTRSSIDIAFNANLLFKLSSSFPLFLPSKASTKYLRKCTRHKQRFIFLLFLGGEYLVICSESSKSLYPP